MPLGDDEGLARFGEPIESTDGEQVGILRPNNRWRIDGYDVGEGDTHSTAEDREELATHLPDGWEITQFDPWGPDRTNHGGPIAWSVHIEHTDGTTLQLRPASTFSYHGRSKSRTYNSHKLMKKTPDNAREELLSAETMSRLSHPAAVFKALLVAAEEHLSQSTLTQFDQSDHKSTQQTSC